MHLKTKINYQKLFVIVGMYMTLGALITVYDHFLVLSVLDNMYPSEYSLIRKLLFNVLAGLMGGTLGGIFLIFYFHRKFGNKPYGLGIIAVMISFIVIVSFITVSLGIIFVPLQSGKALSDPQGKAAFYSYIQDPLHIKNIIVWSGIVALTQFFLQLNDKFGQGLLWAFMRGKYHKSREENRIFMFLDLRSSTTIAEQIGHNNYYNLLKDFYADITDAIIYNLGQIYQYVGDEVVVSWTMKEGIANNKCLKCYFEMRKAIADKKEIYLNKYGLVPEFKAGLHYGIVTVGEIGVIKKDIAYSGDVLNTAARIQGQCNQHKVNLLVSSDLLELLDHQLLYKIIPIGEIHLRGKEIPVSLNTIKIA